jgi:hypothetical protein
MDTWSDQCLQPYLAITAHWIASIEGTSALQLKAALIAFHRLRRNHTGNTISRTVMHLLDRAGITVKVSTMSLHRDQGMLMDVLVRSFHTRQCIEQPDYDGVPRGPVCRT